MRVAFVTTYFPPQQSAGANRLAAFARAFRDRGIPVTVYAAQFSDDGPLGPSDKDLVSLTKWLPAPSVRRSSFLVRFKDEWALARRMFAVCQSAKYDFVAVTTPSLSLLLLAPFCVDRRKLVIDVRDLTWEYRISPSLIVRFLQRVLTFWSLWALGRTRLIVTATEAEQEYIETRLPKADVMHVANGVERQTLERLASPSVVTGIVATRPCVFYAGALGRAQGVSIVAAAAARLPAWDFMIVGDGIEAETLHQEKADRSLDNLDLLGVLPRKEVLCRYSRAAVLFVRLRPGFSTAVPSKVYEYLAAGKPLVYMGAPDDAAWQLLQRFTGTYRADDEDVASLVEAIETAHANGVADVAANRRILDGYTREAQADRLIDRLEAICLASPQ
jgi:glycosyltransferase involved in cell wall biosynthesis